MGGSPDLGSLCGPSGRRLRRTQSLQRINGTDGKFITCVCTSNGGVNNCVRGVAATSRCGAFDGIIFGTARRSICRTLTHRLHPRGLRGVSSTRAHGQSNGCIRPFRVLAVNNSSMVLIMPTSGTLTVTGAVDRRFRHVLLRLSSSLTIRSTSLRHPRGSVRHCRPARTTTSQYRLDVSTKILVATGSAPVCCTRGLAGRLLGSTGGGTGSLGQSLRCCNNAVSFLIVGSIAVLSSGIKRFHRSNLIVSNGLGLCKTPCALRRVNKLVRATGTLGGTRFPQSRLCRVHDLLRQNGGATVLGCHCFQIQLNGSGRHLLRRSFRGT